MISVLIVDEKTPCRDLLQADLERVGCIIHTLADWTEVQAFIHRSPVDVLVSRTTPSERLIPDIPFIRLTGREELWDTSSGSSYSPELVQRILQAGREREKTSGATDMRRAQALIRNSSDLIRIIDGDGTITFNSPSSEKILGYPPEFFIGKSPLEFIHPDDLPGVEADLQEVYDKKNSGTPSLFRIRKADGSYTWVESVAGNLLNTPGIAGIVITSHPVDDRISAQLALAESEQKFRDLFLTMTEGVLYQDTEMEITDLNPAAERLIGMRKEDICGHTPEELDLHLTSESESSTPWPDPAGKDRRESHTTTLGIMHGEKADWILLTQTPEFREGERDPFRFFTTMKDITPLREREQELARQYAATHAEEERYRHILNTMMEGFQIIGPDGRFRYLNEVVVSQSGYTREELSSHTLLELYPGFEKSDAYQAIFRCMQERVPARMTNKMIYPDGKSGWFDLNIQPVTEGVSILSVDVTDRMRNEEAATIRHQELEEAYRKIHQIEQELRARFAELQQKNRELEESQQVSRLISENTSDIVWILHPEQMRLMYVSESVKRMLGYTVEEMMACPIKELIGEQPYQEIQAVLRSRISRFTAGDESVRIVKQELDQYHKEGRIIPTEVVTTLLADSSGTITRILGITRDITERRRSEEESRTAYEKMERRVAERTAELKYALELIREKQERLDFAQKIAHHGSFEVDIPSGTAHWSKEFYTIFGYEPDSFSPRYTDIISAIHPKDRDKTLRSINKAISKERPFNLNLRIIRPDGSIRIVHAIGELTLSPNSPSSQQIRLMGSVQDITQFREAEREKQMISAEIYDLYNNAPCGYHSLDNDGYFVRMNNTELIWLGYTKEEIISKKRLSDVIIPEERQRFAELFERFKKVGLMRDMEYTMIRSDGSEFPVILNSTAIYDNLGAFVMSRTTVFDNTERKLMEEQIIRSLREKETLLKEVHHRVKNNMQVVSSLLFMQARSISDKKVRKILKESQDRIKSIALVHEKLYQSVDLQFINYSEYIQNFIRYLEDSYQTGQRGIVIRCDLQELYLSIDKAVPCSLILNEIFTNSIKHAFPDGNGGTIRIAMRREADTFILTYSDNGIGIPEDITLTHARTLGMQLIQGLTEQVNGMLTITRDGGTAYRLAFS